MENDKTRPSTSAIRARNVEHVIGTSALASLKPSAFMEGLFELYKSGELSSGEVVQAVHARYRSSAQS